MAYMDVEQEDHGETWRISSYFVWGKGSSRDDSYLEGARSANTL